MIKKILILSLVILFSLSLNSCLSTTRSAKGLKENQVQVSYNAPTGANIRYGIDKNIETRIVYEGQLGNIGGDIFIHFHPEVFDYGFGFGYYKNINGHFHDISEVNFTVSKEFLVTGKKINPYFAISYDMSPKAYNEDLYSPIFLLLGCEWIVYRKDNFSFTVTPQYIIPYSGTIGFGFSWDL